MVVHHSRVIVLADRADSHEGCSVLVGFEGINIVQGRWLRWVTIAGREVNAHCEVDLAATLDILQERVCLCDL